MTDPHTAAVPDRLSPSSIPANRISGLDGLARVLGVDGSAAGTAALPAAAPVSRLGALSERYESGGRGAGTVSSGLRDPGGVSYGLYQMSSKTGTVAAFLAAEGVRWSRDFIGKTPGSPAFGECWTAIAARDPVAFAQAQHAFIERTHYRPLVRTVQGQTGLDLDTRSAAVRDVCWSCAVQHGGAAKILLQAIAKADSACPRGGPGFDRVLIEAIYAVRSAYVTGVAGKLEAGSRRALQDIVRRRYPDELARALAMLPGGAEQGQGEAGR